MLNFLKVFFCITVSCVCFSTHGFFKIVEILPNTTDDKNLEYITLKNISDNPQSLSGYILADKKKEYLFEEDIILEPEEKMNFFRPETKLVLNNSDEEVYLYDSQGETVDEVSYESSTKGDFLSFQEITTENIDLMISDEQRISGEIYISDEALVNELPLEDNTQEETEIPEVTPEQEEEEILSVPEVVFSLQRPSYITQSGSTDMYLCDNDREACSVNFDLRESFSDEFPERDYECDIDFGIGVPTSQEGRCNPNTVVFPEGEFEVIFRIWHEDNEQVFREKSISLFNITGTVEEEETNQEAIPQNIGGVSEILSQQQTEQGGSIEQEILGEEEILFVPEVVFSLQRPSYITQSGSTDMYLCDNEREECSVNFDLRESFSDEFPEKDYQCDIDFGIGVLTAQEGRCNPNTVVFPEGEFEVIFRIWHEDNEHVFREKIISIQNRASENILFEQSEPGQDKEQEKINISFGSNATEKIDIDTPIFEVQSGLTRKGSRYYCNKIDCKINLEYEEKNEKEKCFWEFGKGEASSSSTHSRCNPGYVSFESGIHKISLQVYQDNNIYNSQSRVFTLYNLEQTFLGEENSQDEQEKNMDEEENSGNKQEIYSYIVLQGKLSKEKRMQEDILYCEESETCYVNLLGELSYVPDDVEYLWMLNGEVFSDRINPLGVWVGEGKHEIEFLTYSDNAILSQEYFHVEVLPKLGDTASLGSILAENTESVLFEEIATKAVKIPGFTQNFLVLKYDGLRISGKAEGMKKVELYVGETKIGESSVDEKGKYRIVSQNFVSGEYDFDTKLTGITGKEIFIQTSGSTSVQDTDIILWKQKKTPKKQSVSNGSNSSQDGNLILQQQEFWPEESEIHEIPFSQKIFLMIIISLTFIFCSLHIVSHRGNTLSQSILSIYKLKFSTRQRVSIIL